MTFKDLRKRVSSTSTQQEQEQQQSSLVLLSNRLRNKPFWIWNIEEHKQEDIRTKGDCCFNHIIGLPQKNGVDRPLYDYQIFIYDSLITHPQPNKHLWIKKAAGLGISEFMLRFMGWLCLKDNALSGSQMCIVTGPRIDLAIGLIDRMKKLFQLKLGIIFDTRETVIELNNVRIEAFPSHHLDAARGLPNVSFILLDEADFFPIGQQQDARDVSERYIAKSNPYIVMVSTPNAPDGLFERIEKEPEETCLYKRLFLDYTYGLGRIYTEEEIAKAKESPSFEREYNLKYLGMIGNVFHTKYIDTAIEKGDNYNPPNGVDEVNYYTQKSMGIDPGFGSSAFGVVVTQKSDKLIQVLEAEEYYRPDFNQMLSIVWDLLQKYGRSINKIYIDGANPSFLRALKLQMGEDEEYDEIIKDCKARKRDYEYDMTVVPVNFSMEHKSMLGNVKMLLEKDGGYVAINPKFDKLITSLRTAVEKGEGMLDKEATSYDDIFDAFRLAMRMYYFKSKDDDSRTRAYVYSI